MIQAEDKCRQAFGNKLKKCSFLHQNLAKTCLKYEKDDFDWLLECTNVCQKKQQSSITNEKLS